MNWSFRQETYENCPKQEDFQHLHDPIDAISCFFTFTDKC